MKNLFLLFCVILILLSCKQVTPPPDTTQKVKDSTNIALVKNTFKALESENLEALKGFYSDSIGVVGPAFNNWYGKEQLIKNLASWFESADSIKFSIFYIMAETIEEGDLAGDWILLWADGSFYDMAAQKKIKFSYHAGEKIQDGKIVIEANYWDEWDIYMQMGAELKWPEKKK